MIPKYRAWDKTDKEMYLVDEINFNRGEFESIGDGITFLREADEVELMQSTGLFDKNGQEIFEGDIVSDGYDTGDIKNHETLGFYMVDKKGIECWFSDGATIEDFEEYVKTAFKTIEVIGNIYENPELLEADNDRD